jgi:hypothetical protein
VWRSQLELVDIRAHRSIFVHQAASGRAQHAQSKDMYSLLGIERTTSGGGQSAVVHGTNILYEVERKTCSDKM